MNISINFLGRLNESSRCPSLHEAANNFYLSELFNFLFPLIKINLEREREKQLCLLHLDIYSDENSETD